MSGMLMPTKSSPTKPKRKQLRVTALMILSLFGLIEPVEDARIICSRLARFNWREHFGKRPWVLRRPACLPLQLTIVSYHEPKQPRSQLKELRNEDQSS